MLENTFEFSVFLLNLSLILGFFLYFSIVCCSFFPDLYPMSDLVCRLGGLGLFILLLNS